MSETTFVESAPSDVSLNDNLANETLPDLSDYAEEPGGALTPGWYKADVVEGYQTRKGKQMTTTDEVSKDGSSRNLRVCFKLSPIKGDPRFLQVNFNYRPSDFTPERLAFIKEQREIYRGVQGRWADSDAQRSSLAIAQLGQFQKALGFQFSRNSAGTIVVGPLVGQQLDVRVRIDKSGFNEISEYAAKDTKTPGTRSTNA